MEITAVLDMKALMKLCKALSFAEPVAHNRSKLAWTLGCGGARDESVGPLLWPLDVSSTAKYALFCGVYDLFYLIPHGLQADRAKLTPESRSCTNKHIQSQ